MTVETLRPSSLPTIGCTTIARAERLALAGLGWSADQVLRRALDLLEGAHLEPEPAGHVFTREEIVAALAGDDLEGPNGRPPEAQRYLSALARTFDRDLPDDGSPNDPAYMRQLLATAEALDPDPYCCRRR
jgi:hypothetical protein